MKPYKLLIFDFDGTLCDTDEVVVQGFLKLYEIYESPFKRAREEIYYFSGPPLKETMAIEFPQYPVEEMVEAYVEASRAFYNEQNVALYEGEVETLKALKEAGYLLGIVTNKRRESLMLSLELCQIKDFFEVIISADDVKIPKPAPEGIFKAMKIMGVNNPAEVLYIGDNDIDFKTTVNAGVDAMIVTWGPREIACRNKAKYQVKSFQEIGETLLCAHLKQ